MSSIHLTPPPGPAVTPTQGPVTTLGRRPEDIVEAARGCPAANALYNRALIDLAPDALHRWERRQISQRRTVWRDEHRAVPAALAVVAQVGIAVGAQATKDSPWRTRLAWDVLLFTAVLQCVPALTNRDVHQLWSLRTPVVQNWWNTATFILLIGTVGRLAIEKDDLPPYHAAAAMGAAIAAWVYGFYAWESRCTMAQYNRRAYEFRKPRLVARSAWTLERLTALPALNAAVHRAVHRREVGTLAFLGGLGVPMDLADESGRLPLDIVLQNGAALAAPHDLITTVCLSTTLLHYGASPTAGQFRDALATNLVELAHDMLTVPKQDNRRAVLASIDMSCLWQAFEQPMWRSPAQRHAHAATTERGNGLSQPAFPR